MGSIWNAAKRGEGYQLARDSNITWLLVSVLSIGHGVFRFFSGRPMLGDTHRKTHATWSKASNQLLNSKDRPAGWWSCLAEKHRAAIRVGLLIIAIGIVWGWWDGPFSSLTHGLVTIAGIAITWAGLYLMTKGAGRRLNERRHGRGFLDPMRTAVGPIIGVAADQVKVRIPRRNVNGGN
jgi:hypothetical protein